VQVLADQPPDALVKPGKAQGPRVLFAEKVVDASRPPRPSLAPLPKTSPDAPHVLFGAPRQPTAKGDKPKVLASGEVRTRILCSAADLHALDATASPAIIAQALRIIDGTNLDDHHFDDTVRFGVALQAEHGRLADAELTLVGSEALATGSGLAAELLQCLDQLDPNAVFDTGSGFMGALKNLGRSRDPRIAFDRLMPRIDALAGELRALAPAILAVATDLRALVSRYRRLDRGLAAHVLAGQFLARHIAGSRQPDAERQAHYASQAEAIETRVASLLATKASVAIGQRTLAVVTATIETLGWSGQDLLQEELPAWRNAYAAALIASRTAPDPVLFSTLRDLHTRIISKLRSKG
jgi:hypothetical protein